MTTAKGFSLIDLQRKKSINLERRQCFANSICCFNSDILCITETCLTKDAPANSLFLSDFPIVRSGRPRKIDFFSSHGGVLIAFKQSLKVSKRADNKVDPCDVLFASIDRGSCLIACIYILPKNSPYYWTTTKIPDFFETLRLLLLHGTHPLEYMVITGDLNFSCTNWGIMESTDPSEILFLDNLFDHGFQQKLHESAGTSLELFLISSEVKHINSCICLELEKLLMITGTKTSQIMYRTQVVSWNMNQYKLSRENRALFRTSTGSLTTKYFPKTLLTHFA